MHTRTKIVCVIVASVPLLTGLILAAVFRPPQFSINIATKGRWQDHTKICCSASVANSGSSACILNSLRYEWKDAVGQIRSASAFSNYGRSFQPAAVETVTFLIPSDAQSVRVCVLYNASSSLRRRIGSVREKLALNSTVCRFPKLALWLMRTGDNTDHSFLSRWTANEQR